ncbi:hypothetical protein A2U01_0099920, partial [Trifolium medium]|nr:hypothetical protein [Trifolium medium]
SPTEISHRYEAPSAAILANAPILPPHY